MSDNIIYGLNVKSQLVLNNIKRYSGIVTHMKFESDIKLRAGDAIMLQQNGIIEVVDDQKNPYALVKRKNPKFRSYYRANRDNSTENNLKSLPSFEPTI